jgi:hypothetical protein
MGNIQNANQKRYLRVNKRMDGRLRLTFIFLSSYHSVGFEVFTAVSMKMAVFWVVAPCSLVELYQRFRGPCYQTTRCYNPEDNHLQLPLDLLRQRPDVVQTGFVPFIQVNSPKRGYDCFVSIISCYSIVTVQVKVK